MTRAKADIPLPPRPRSYPAADECAAEFSISPATWLKWVEQGRAPPAIPETEKDAPRWRWADVDTWFSYPAERERIRARYRGEIVADDGEPGNVMDPFIANAGKLRHAPPQKGKCRG